MQLSNPFPEHVRNRYLDVYKCMLCGRSDQGLELHHIMGRVSDSIFNACCICTVCHNRMNHSQAEEIDCFVRNAWFLASTKYKATPHDIEFLETYTKRLNVLKSVIHILYG